MPECIKTTFYHELSPGIARDVEHVFDVWATHYCARGLGGGGAGQGANSGSGARASAGSPGGAGAEGNTGAVLIPIPPDRMLAIHVGEGARGTTPVAGINAADGGNTRVTDNDRGTWEFTGGSGGQEYSSDTPPYVMINSNGRGGIALDPDGRVIGAGQRGGVCLAMNVGNALYAFADGGASSSRGRGFEGVHASGKMLKQGRDAEGYGAGGGGSVSIDSGAVRGGHGTGGEVEITEYRMIPE